MMKRQNAAKKATERKQDRAVELVRVGLTFDEAARVLGYTHRAGAYQAYLAGMARQALRAQHEAATAA